MLLSSVCPIVQFLSWVGRMAVPLILLMCSSIKVVRCLVFRAKQQMPLLEMLTAVCTRVLKSGSRGAIKEKNALNVVYCCSDIAAFTYLCFVLILLHQEIVK